MDGFFLFVDRSQRAPRVAWTVVVPAVDIRCAKKTIEMCFTIKTVAALVSLPNVPGGPESESIP